MDVIFVHGWSDEPKSMQRVAAGLRATGLAFDDWYFGYRSQDDEATLADYAEGLHLWLQHHRLLPKAAPAGGAAVPRTLHFVTHSTGALVVRRWLRQFAWARAADCVATVTFLAPANFGSPLAHKGKSLLGHLAKGIRGMRDLGETGRRTLEALELAAPAQWELADFDLFGDAGTPYGANGVRATVITGASGYGGLRAFVNEDGTDGTIVVAGAGLSSRKFTVDFAAGSAYAGWIREKKRKPDVPTLILAAPNHSTILDLEDDAELAGLVRRSVSSTPAGWQGLLDDFAARTEAEKALPVAGGGPRQVCQQFLVRAADDRGDPIDDWFLEFGAWRRDRIDPAAQFPGPARVNGRLPNRDRHEAEVSAALKRHVGATVHTHSVAPSYRRFLVEPSAVTRLLGDDYVLCLDMVARSGDPDIHYDTGRFSGVLVHDPRKAGSVSWLHPDTTTLLELRVDRFTDGITTLGRQPKTP